MKKTSLNLLRASLSVLAVCSAFPLAAARNDKGDPRMMQGPMIGAAGPTEITIWGRLSGPYDYAIQYDTAIEMPNPKFSKTVTARLEDDYTVLARLEGLEPDTIYYYRVYVDGDPGDYLAKKMPFRTKTAPAEGERVKFSVALGSCTKLKDDSIQKIWLHVREAAPDLFFNLGDYVYADTIYPKILAEEYRRQRDVELLQPVIHSIPQLATWDDHDYGLNDHDRTNPIREDSLSIFSRYWANPSYGLPDVPGIFSRYHYGGVDFFILDGRYHRDPNADPDVPGKTMLGAGQLAWLKEELVKSDAPFKVLISGSVWTAFEGLGGDSWASFLHEREELFDFIRDHEIAGVILVSGDQHRAELNAIPWSDRGGYDFYEFVSSPLVQDTSSDEMGRLPDVRIREPYTGAASFGLFTFDLRDEPKLTYRNINVYNEQIFKPLELRASELVNGKSTWREKIEESELRLREAAPRVEN